MPKVRRQKFSKMIALTRLSLIPIQKITDLLNDEQVRRHLPLAGEYFDEALTRAWIASKEEYWLKYGYGPYAILIANEFAGWSGVMHEDGEDDLGIVLFKQYWGYGRRILKAIIDDAARVHNLRTITIQLPVSRVRQMGITRAGFEETGTTELMGHNFRKYRLHLRPGVTKN